jgi:hypothetical protein
MAEQAADSNIWQQLRDSNSKKYILVAKKKTKILLNLLKKKQNKKY